MATGTVERKALIKIRKRVSRAGRSTLGGDSNNDTHAHVGALRGPGLPPDVAQITRDRASEIDDRTTSYAGYEISRRK